MVRAVFQRGAAGIMGFSVDGHTGLAPRGEDVLCAAVSALAQGVLIGLEEVVGLDVDVDIRDGRLRCGLPDQVDAPRRAQASVLLETLLVSLRSLERDHEEHLQVRELVRGEGGAGDAHV